MQDAVEILILEHHAIKFFDETDYKVAAMATPKLYSKLFLSDDNSQATSKIGIEIFEEDTLVTSCLIGSDGGHSGLTGDTTLISYGGLVVCCGNTVFKLTIPNLDLEWKTVADTMTCFGIHYLEQDYVVHGELEITRLDKNGKIVWQQSGRDIWTTPDDRDDFSVTDDYILATDWQYNCYKYDYNGNLIDEYKSAPNKVSQTNLSMKTKKWWKLW